jgi:hypothetical protein
VGPRNRQLITLVLVGLLIAVVISALAGTR